MSPSPGARKSGPSPHTHPSLEPPAAPTAGGVDEERPERAARPTAHALAEAGDGLSARCFVRRRGSRVRGHLWCRGQRGPRRGQGPPSEQVPEGG